MNRREALSIVSAIFGGTIAGSVGFLNGCKPRQNKPAFGVLSPEQIRLLEELAEVILPKTQDSPGAKDTGIGNFILSIVTDCYSESEQTIFREGVEKIDEISIAGFREPFLKLNPSDRLSVVRQLEDESSARGKPIHFYTMMKQLFVWGYLSSELVGTTVLRHIPIPGRYEGCVEYRTGEKSFI